MPIHHDSNSNVHRAICALNTNSSGKSAGTFSDVFWDKLTQDIMRLMNEDERALYESLQLDIQRADMARYLILYHEGGYYADLDIYSFDSWRKLVDRVSNLNSSQPQNGSASNLDFCVLLEELYLSEENLDELEHSAFRQTYFQKQYKRPPAIQLANYWMASTKGHPLLKMILELLRERSRIPVDVHQDYHPILWTSGPGLVSEAYYNIYLKNKSVAENRVVTIPRDEWRGPLSCTSVYHIFHLADYWPQCRYFYHLGHGSWKDDQWCERDAIRCLGHYGVIPCVLSAIVLVIFCRRYKRNWPNCRCYSDIVIAIYNYPLLRVKAVTVAPFSPLYRVKIVDERKCSV